MRRVERHAAAADAAVATVEDRGGLLQELARLRRRVRVDQLSEVERDAPAPVLDRRHGFCVHHSDRIGPRFVIDVNDSEAERVQREQDARRRQRAVLEPALLDELE